MTREEAKKQLVAYMYYAIDDMPEEVGKAFDVAISALSAEGEYIKKEDLFNKTVRRNSIWNGTTNAEGKGLEEIVNDLPTYSFPDREKGGIDPNDMTHTFDKVTSLNGIAEWNVRGKAE